MPDQTPEQQAITAAVQAAIPAAIKEAILRDPVKFLELALQAEAAKLGALAHLEAQTIAAKASILIHNKKALLWAGALAAAIITGLVLILR